MRAGRCWTLAGGVAWTIPSRGLARPPHPVTRQLTREPSPISDAAYKHREDLIDALLCAWTAALWARHGLQRCQVLGLTAQATDTPAATIIVPARPDQRRSSRHIHPKLSAADPDVLVPGGHA
jgi:predicted RNase H-like nuclease